ncbi:MAG: hypothetical protein CO093_08450 [Alphaproteobacteria bacterium CG_4_9_14_3_um_filter_47_13]|nr:MAG: hypothetical protein CO093_08450 [Alphaproteobacteria bacterium CG_4_9_14_3_um_filter_47_13]
MVQNKLKVLLVEDSKLGVYALKQIIEKSENLSVELIHRASMRYALECIEKEEINLILLDLGLPDTSSDEESFALVKKAAPETPIIVLTGRCDQDFADNMVMKGAQDYINKDELNSNPDILVKAIRFALSRNQVLQKMSEQLEEKDKTISWMSGDYSVEDGHQKKKS